MFLWKGVGFLLIFSFVFSVGRRSTSPYIIRGRDVTFHFQTERAEILIYPGSIASAWYKLAFTHLEEYDANFQQKYTDVKFGTNFTYTQISCDDSVHNLNMSALLPSGARVAINYYVYSKPTTIKIGGQVLTFHASSLRFNIQIFSWNFQQPTNKLHFHMAIQSSRSQEADIGRHFVKIKGSDNDTLFIELPRAALLDNQLRNVSIAVDIANEEDDSPIDIAILFDRFNVSSYDPDMGLLFASSRVVDNIRVFSLAALILMGVAGFLAAVFGGGVAFFVWKRRQQRRHYIRYY